MKRPVSVLALCLAAATPALPARPAVAAPLLDYVGQCVPFARAASGIQIYGDAWSWWGQARGRYERGVLPRIGAVVVFARSARLPLGHVAVVSHVVERRVVMLTHANWSRVNGARGHAEQDVTLFDVSPRNDWSQVKVWFRDAGALGGTVYPVSGFVYGTPDRNAAPTEEGHDPGGGGGGSVHPSPELTGRAHDDVAALIDAYVR
ncbi:CHAP domain-containing protein [Sphingomonas bacterium]|uniref:CHAP domain-containing protein n=1 Tax=Sphingomonas bacterium TaxID=1895847 RepID=UPI0015765CC5|nr:CHAP domain-containing protein [Sphingomonas bacterium]